MTLVPMQERLADSGVRGGVEGGVRRSVRGVG